MSRLLSLDQACLENVIAFVHGNTRLQLLRTCTTFRDLILRSPAGATLQINLDETACTAARSALRRASLPGHCRQLSLQLTSDGLAGDSVGSALFAGMGYVHGCTTVVLKGMRLESLVPSFIINPCSNLHTLRLIDCSAPDDWSANPVAHSLPTCTSLTQLVLEGTDIGAQPHGAIRQQLTKLPGLSCFSSSDAAVYLHTLTALGTQLTALGCADLDHDHDDMDWAEGFISQQLQRLADNYTAVIRLQLDNLMVYDEDLDQLLRMPQLTDLWVKGFLIHDNYSDRPCSWKRLHVQYMPLPEMRRLPLRPPMHIGLYGEGARVELRGELAEKLAKLMRCGGLHCDMASTVRLDRNCRELSSVLRLFQHSCPKQLMLRKQHITPALVEAMGRHLTGPGLLQICFEFCDWDPLVWCTLLASLPPVAVVELRDDRYDLITEAQVLEVCSAARPVTLVVCTGLGRDLKWTADAVNAKLSRTGVFVFCYQYPD